jgi:hypothetical protein
MGVIRNEERMIVATGPCTRCAVGPQSKYIGWPIVAQNLPMMRALSYASSLTFLQKSTELPWRLRSGIEALVNAWNPSDDNLILDEVLILEKCLPTQGGIP